MSTDDAGTPTAAPTTPPAAPAAPAAPAGTLAALVLDAAAKHQGTALRYALGGGWQRISYPALGEGVRQIAKGLMALGVQAGDRVAILSNTRAEWTLADFGAICAGAIVIPVYQTNSPEECQYVLEHSGATAIFCENEEQLGKLREIRGALPQLREVIAFEGKAEDALSMEGLRERGNEVGDEQLDARVAGIAPGDVATIVYTSGTTGPPKGCMLTHANFRSAVDMVMARLDTRSDEVVYIFLPLAHVLTRLVQLFSIDAGSELAYWRRDPRKIVEDVAITQPTHLPSVPRIFEKIYTAATAKVAAAGGLKLKLFDWAFDVGRKVRALEREGRAPGRLLGKQYQLADALVLNKVRALFGGRIRLALTGAAPIDEEILSFFHAAGVWVLEGFGMTETSSIATLNTIPEHKLGTVGRAVPGTDLKIADDGEILIRGPQVFTGYYNDPAATAATLKDGWLYSGDLGEIDADGYLRITGRKKDLIITSSGKNVSPSNIETALTQSRWISQAVVYGDRRKYLTALLTIDADEAAALAETVGAKDSDVAALAADPAVRAELQKAVDESNKRFARVAQVKRFAILERDLSQEHEELTPTLKVKRNVVYERYADVFEGLYDNG
ncbi:MAG: long-chain acyl-CoA synthetase [Solirubrobacteraceae bacterium]|jgi:long-chain acyl-CoA synthetase|nr:long-chain acyl-CoA synthetase [Solirubrobacteraceae bacterium]